jgi:hypothetical protein
VERLLPTTSTSSAISAQAAALHFLSTLFTGARIDRLGWDAYLVAGGQAQDRRDVRYELQTL